MCRGQLVVALTFFAHASAFYLPHAAQSISVQHILNGRSTSPSCTRAPGITMVLDGAMAVASRAVEEAAVAARFVARSYSTTFQEGTIGKVCVRREESSASERENRCRLIQHST